MLTPLFMFEVAMCLRLSVHKLLCPNPQDSCCSEMVHTPASCSLHMGHVPASRYLQVMYIYLAEPPNFEIEPTP